MAQELDKKVKSKWAAKACVVSADGNKIHNSSHKTLSYQSSNVLRPELHMIIKNFISICSNTTQGFYSTAVYYLI